jgi:hypothetical protein
LNINSNINNENQGCKIGTMCGGGYWWEEEGGRKEINVRAYG